MIAKLRSENIGDFQQSNNECLIEFLINFGKIYIITLTYLAINQY